MNTTPPDEAADVRAAHDRVYRVSQIRTANAVIAVYGPFVGREHDYDDDRLTLSRAYLDLTDPTPLTVEVLVGMGFTVKSKKLETWIRNGLTALRQEDTIFVFATEFGGHVWPTPRTVGELRQLLRRLEPPHAAR